MRRARSNAALLLPSAFRRRYAPLPGGALSSAGVAGGNGWVRATLHGAVPVSAPLSFRASFDKPTVRRDPTITL
jgi:hypothetical protein